VANSERNLTAPNEALAVPLHILPTAMPLSIQRKSEGAEPAPLGEMALVRAFAAFTEAAESLQSTYTELQREVARLRQELQETNCDLARSLEQNRRMRQHLNRILEGLPCGVLVTESDGAVSIVNPEARRMLGAISGVGFEGLQQVPLWMQELLDDARAAAGEREHRCAGGPLEWLSIRHAQLETAEGGSSIFILRDISEAKRLEDARETLRRRQALAEMSALLAHEVRNPLGSLELFAELLAKATLETEPQRWARQLQAGLRALAATVNNVLHFHGHPQPEMAPTDLGLLLGSLAEFLRPLAQQAGVRLQLSAGLDGVRIAADRHRLEQVVLNLGLNAFRFMSAGGELRITGSVTGEDSRRRAEVEVADTGAGIRPENLERVFEPGFTTRPGSPGLGLAVCRTIMQQHGGAITVTSRAGAGTVFHLEFPLLEASR
jgi:two-component system, sensor histidine kinase FlrB